MDTNAWITLILGGLGLLQAGAGGTLVWVLGRQTKAEERQNAADRERGKLFGAVDKLETRLAEREKHEAELLRRIEAKVDEALDWQRRKDKDISDFWKDEAKRGGVKP